MFDRLNPRCLQVALLGAALLAVAALGAASAFYSHRHLKLKQARIVALHREAADAQRLMLLAVDSQAAIRHWMLSGRPEDRDTSLRVGDALGGQGRELVARLEHPLTARGLPSLGAALEHVLRVRGQVHEQIERAGPDAAGPIAARSGGTAAMQQLRNVLNEFRAKVDEDVARLDVELRDGQRIGLLLIGGSSFAMLAMLLGAVALLARRRSASERARAEMDRRGREVAALFRMGELLQSSLSPDDMRRVVAHTAEELLPELEGAFYTFNNSRDRLDLLGAWGHCALPPRVPEHFAPGECWALKRGRPHGCGVQQTLRCDHAGTGEPGAAGCSLFVPMQARGEVHGVLSFSAPAGTLLSPAQVELATALADGVSLALANLALREKLRNQALRDELTGLYNRRFLEETLPRLATHAERRNAPISMLMLDLDHFKQVNDRYGHAVGDAVLREVGRLLLARLRRMDVACRYGGEEHLVLMPDCAAADALVRGQELCDLVRGLRDRADSGLPPVTVSIGVAAWLEHGERIGAVIEAADAALYTAKRGGRDRAVPAEAAAPGLVLPALTLPG